MGKTDKILWEDAILKVVETSGGVATLKEFYQHVPQIRKISSSSDVNHVVRAYLRRMTISGKLKRVGLGIYALPEIKLKRNLFEGIQKGKTKKEMFRDIKDSELRSYIEGMLIELGNIYGYLTYTADPSSIFNGKPLKEIATLERIPDFTSPALLNITKTIDVIFFEKRATIVIPKHTFDVEITIDFSKALHRAYQLRDFRTTFYVVGLMNKYDQFQKRLTTDSYHEIRDRIFFRSTDDIFCFMNLLLNTLNLRIKLL